MDLTGGTRNTAVAGAAVMLGGLAVILHGVIRGNPSHSAGGGFIAIIGLTIVALVLIYRWVTDTQDERRALAAAQREAQAERARYFAAQAALENEQGRLARDLVAEKQAMAVRLKAERVAMAAEFEKQRSDLISDTMEATVLMYRNGRFAPDTFKPGNLIPFPGQQPQPVRERSREHGVVGP